MSAASVIHTTQDVRSVKTSMRSSRPKDSITQAITRRNQPSMVPLVTNLTKPLATTGSLHRHQVFVQECDEIHVVSFLQFSNHSDDVSRRVIAKISPVGKNHISVPTGSLLNKHVACRTEMPTVAANERATVRPVDVNSPFAFIDFLAEQSRRVFEIYLQRKQIPSRPWQTIEIVNHGPRFVQHRPSLIPPDHPQSS